MNDNFHDLFKQSVPEAPSPQGWVQGARRKRRNRQVVAGGVAALVVAGVAVPLALNLQPGCGFYDRCSERIEGVCNKVDPTLCGLGNEHCVACHKCRKEEIEA